MLLNSIKASLFPHLRDKFAREDGGLFAKPVAGLGDEIQTLGSTSLDAPPETVGMPDDGFLAKYVDIRETAKPNLSQDFNTNLNIKPGEFDFVSQSPGDKAQAEYDKIRDEGVKKRPAWQQAMWMALQFADQFVNKDQAQDPKWLGQAIYDKKLSAADAKLEPFRQEQARQQKQAEEAQRGRLNEANIRNVELKPEFEKQKIELQRSKQKQKIQDDTIRFEREIAKIEKRAEIAGEKWVKYIDEETGRVYKTFPNDPKRDPEPLNKPGTNEQMVAPSYQVYDYTSENGTTVQVKGRDVVQGDIAKANLNLSRERADETKRTNRVREGLAQQQFTFARQKWIDTLRLRNEAIQKKDEAAAQKYAGMLKNWSVAWKSKIGTGGFTEEDYLELIGEDTPPVLKASGSTTP